MGVFELITSWRADRRIRNLLRHADHRALGDVPEHAFVRVTGVVEAHRSRVLEAPLSGRLCAYYAIVVRSRPVTAYEQRKRRTVFDEQEGVPFQLVSDDTRAIIDPTDAWISSAFDHEADLSNPRAREIIKRAGLVGAVDRPKLQEAILGVGARIALFGAAVKEPDRDGVVAEQGYRDGGPTRLRFSGSAKFPLVIRDDLASL